MIFYKMNYDKSQGDYVQIENFPECINKRAVLFSEFQYIDKAPINIVVSENGGIEFPDFIDEYNFPLFSNKLKQTLDNFNIENIFYKPVYLIDELIEQKKLYWLAIPDRIDCLNKEKCKYDTDLDFEVITKIAIFPHKVGNYEIFKIKDINDDDFIITEKLKLELQKQAFAAISFTKITN